MPPRALALLGLILAGGLVAAQEAPLVDVVRDGQGRVVARVDWAGREIRAVGRARRARGLPRSAAERAAILDAYAKLGLAARGARVDAGRVVSDLPDDDQQLAGWLVTYIRGAAIGALEDDDEAGWSRLTVTAPLYGVEPLGGPRGLGSYLYRRDDVWARDVQPTNTTDRGVLFDARGLGVRGGFAPTIRDETGRVVWHVECADRPKALVAGAVEYRATIDAEAPREGDAPLVIRVLRTAGGCDMVVAVTDGERLAPRRVGGSFLFAGLQWIRTITPVSPFRLAAVVTDPPATDEIPNEGER